VQSAINAAAMPSAPAENTEKPTFCGCVEEPTDESRESSSLFILSGSNPLRLLALRLVKSKPFEAFILLLILTNTVFLALENPKSDETPTYEAVGEIVFLVCFSAEMIAKIIAFGVVLHAGSYLRDPWNRMDFVIVLLMYPSLIPGFGNYTAFRALRVLRPLRSMNAVRGLRVLVAGLTYSVSGLANVVMLSAFIFAMFGILGVQLWMGLFRQQCLDDASTDGAAMMHCAADAGDWGLTGSSCPANLTCSGGLTRTLAT
jgi:voltage-dependent calcium channel L type alpha-1D